MAFVPRACKLSLSAYGPAVLASLAAAAAAVLPGAPAHAAPAAFSKDKNNPTALSFFPSGIPISGTVNQTSGSPVGGVSPDAQYVTFSVPKHYNFTSLTLTDYSSTDQRGFVALQAGSQWTSVPSGGVIPGALTWNHFGTGNSGSRPVCALSYVGSTATPSGASACVSNAAANSDLFSRNLPNSILSAQPAGSYTLWIQQTALADVSYTFEANFQSVPGPLPVLGAVAGFGFSRRLRRRLKQGQGA